MRPLGLGVTLIQNGWCPENERDTKDVHTQSKDHEGRSKKAVILKPRREAAGETKPARTFISHLQNDERYISVVWATKAAPTDEPMLHHFLVYYVNNLWSTSPIQI